MTGYDVIIIEKLCFPLVYLEWRFCLVNESNGANGPLGPGLIALAPSILSQENGEQVVVRGGNGPPSARNSQSSGTPPASSARDRGLFDLAFFTSTVTGAPNPTTNGQESGKPI